MYKQKGIRCSDAPAKSTTGSMDKLAKGTSYAGIYFTYVTSDLEPYVVGRRKLINRQHPKSIQFSRVMASANCFTIGYSRVIKKRRDGFTYGLAEKRGKPLSLLSLLSDITLSRIEAIVERGNCIEGVMTALESEDYGSAAKFVQRFLQIDAQYKDSGSDQREQLLESKKQLEGIAKKKLLAAIDQRDHTSILRFVRLYSPLGMEEEGLQLYVGYLKKVITMRGRIVHENVVELMEQGVTQVNFVGCLTNLFKDI
ncbi:unnamed protein product, partial [Brassica oleracea var. botrytis]